MRVATCSGFAPTRPTLPLDAELAVVSERGMASRAARGLWVFVGASLAIALLTTLWFVFETIRVRVPYWGEAEVLFEASRLRARLPLYVDPLVGAHEYGEPPSRFYVTYPPLWAWVISWVPTAAATLFARIACSLAWFGSLAALVWTARRESRLDAGAAALFVGGIWVLANFAMVGRPDSIACAIAALALARAIRMGTLDVLGVSLLVLVPWVKPTLVGLPVGAIVGAALGDRTRTWRILGLAAALAGASAALAHVASHGALFSHVVRSNAQPFTVDAWLEQVPSRLPFFGPLFVWAGWVGWRDRRRAGTRIGLAALGGAVAFTMLSLAKTGSSSNYWMEPCIAAVALISRASPGPLRVGRGGVAHALIVSIPVIWADTASVRAGIEHARTERANAEFVRSARARCGVRPDAVVAADEAGIELVTNGRILTPTYQMVHLVRRHDRGEAAYPPDGWISDLKSPRTQCFIEHTRQLRLAPELQRVIEDEYVALPGDEAVNGLGALPQPPRSDDGLRPTRVEFQLWKRR